MGLGTFLGKVGQALNRGITDYQRTRDFGQDYQNDWAAEQAYLNRFAADREAEKALQRERQARADQEHTEDRKTLLEDRTRKRRDELALALEGAYVPNEANPEQLFLDQGTADQLLLGASPEDRAFALATSRAKVSKAVQAEKKKREQALKAQQDELDIRGKYERGLIGARSAADASGEKRRSDAAIAQALVLGGLQPLLNLGKPKTGAVDPYLALAAREGMPGESNEDTIARAEAFRQAEQLRLRGGARGPAAADPGADQAGQVRVQRHPKTGAVRHSFDGGATWQPGPPPS